jgi:hypothetical protein
MSAVGLIGYVHLFGHIYPEREGDSSRPFLFEIIGGAFENEICFYTPPTSGSEILWKYMAPFPFHKLCTTQQYTLLKMFGIRYRRSLVGRSVIGC